MRPSRELRSCLDRLKPYVAGKGYAEISRKYGIPPEGIIKLGSNENTYGPSPGVIAALREVSPERYPEADDLVPALASYAGCKPEETIIGAGMDGVMDTLSRLFIEPGDRTLVPTPTFSYYEILTVLAGGEPVFAPRGPDFGLPDSMPGNVRMTFICSPNNPTGNVITEARLRQICEGTQGIVFLDEAYVEFADRSLIGLVRDYDNLIVGRTMSKAFGLAGMRLGYAVAPEWIADQYRRAAPPFFGISCATVAAGIAALGDIAYMHDVVASIRAERERLVLATGSHPSQANFIYIETAAPSKEVVEAFQRRGIIIRDCASFRGAGDHHIRVTVGRPEENDSFIEAYGEICG